MTGVAAPATLIRNKQRLAENRWLDTEQQKQISTPPAGPHNYRQRVVVTYLHSYRAALILEDLFLENLTRDSKSTYSVAFHAV